MVSRLLDPEPVLAYLYFGPQFSAKDTYAMDLNSTLLESYELRRYSDPKTYIA